MPYMKKVGGKSVRDYARQNRLVDSTAKARAHRAANVKANRAMEAAGLGRKGDGKDVDHVQPFSKGGSSEVSNLRLAAPSKNRSFSRNADSSLRSQVSKRERKR